MTITISPDDTGEITRAVGEDTAHLTITDMPTRPRRPEATGEIPLYEPRTLAVVDDLTGALPIVGELRPVPTWPVTPDYRGRHRLTLVRRVRRLIGGVR